MYEKFNHNKKLQIKWTKDTYTGLILGKHNFVEAFLRAFQVFYKHCGWSRNCIV